MKKIVFIWISLILITSGCAQKKTEEKTIFGMWTDYYLIPNTLKGKVKEMKELNYWAIESEGKIAKGELMSMKDLDSLGSTPNLIAYFDDKGMLTRYDRLDKDNVTQSRTGTIENGKYKRWDYKLKDSTTSYYIPEYDNLGFLVGASGYRPLVDTLVSKLIAAHDNKGNFTRFEYFNYKNQKTGYHVCSLDEKGNIVEAKYFNNSDTLGSTMINTYDENGNMIKQQTIIEKPKSTSTWDFKNLKLDDHGNLVEYYANIDNGKYKIFVERSFIYY
jgi:hypothetical protein